MRTCDGCGGPMNGFLDRFYTVCMECAKARHRAAVSGKCSCGKKRRPREVKTYCRSWIACDRCLGTVRQIS